MSDEAAEKVSRGEMIAVLRSVADAMESGEACVVQVGGMAIPVPGQAEVEIEYERDGDSEELEIELTWSRKGGRPPARNLRAKAGIGLSLAAAAIAGGYALLDYTQAIRKRHAPSAESKLEPLQQPDPQEG